MRDYLRAQLGTRSKNPVDVSAKALLNEFVAMEGIEESGERPERTKAELVRKLLEYAVEHLPTAQVGALARWLEGQSAQEIGAALAVPADEAQRLLRAAIAALRRQFVSTDLD
jgi:DNA-directed RNA polymerase specialized sigma24 family protein